MSGRVPGFRERGGGGDLSEAGARDNHTIGNGQQAVALRMPRHRVVLLLVAHGPVSSLLLLARLPHAVQGR